MSPTLKHRCPSCQVVWISTPGRCLRCRQIVDRLRGKTTLRGLGWVYQKLRRFVLERDGGVCWLCGQLGADSVDHVLPRSRGGLNTPENLRASHLSCNARRKAQRGGVTP